MRDKRPSAVVVRADYLRLLSVDAALALLVHNLVVTGAMAPDEAGAAVRIRAEQHQRCQVEDGMDVLGCETAIWVAEAVQQDIIAGFGVTPRLVTWPACPRHPNHPLWLRSPDAPAASTHDLEPADPAWTCVTTNQVIAELGAL